MIENMSKSIREWEDGKGRSYSELIRQEYTGNNCIFSGGMVDGCEVPEDIFYLRWEKDGEDATMLLLRPDEVAAIGWLCNGLLWSHTLEALRDGGGEGK